MSSGTVRAGADQQAAAALERWLPYRRPRPAATLRLFCFPYAGGAASAFRGWAEALPEDVEVCAVQPPGRERRLVERAFVRMEPLVEALATALEPLLDRPFLLLGHSLGAKMAYELTRELMRRGAPLPRHLIASGSRAPHMPSDDPPVHRLPDDELVRELHRLGGTPAAVLASEELMSLLLPLLRADFELNETYRPGLEAPLPVPLSAYGGTEDPECPPETIAGWSAHTAAPFRQRMVPGGHFFLHERRDDLLDEVRRDLAAYL
jgi:medium-chain acyl-[acyl-carrier-protein] hydrolase